MDSAEFSAECRELILEYLSNNDCSDAILQSFSETLIDMKERIPILYRYSPADYNNIRSLEKGCLFLSKTGTMNDVFEGLSGYVDKATIKQFEKLGDLAYLKSFTESPDNLRMWAQYGDNYAGMCVAYDFSQAHELLLRHLFPVVYRTQRFPHQPHNFDPEKLEVLKRDLAEGYAISHESSVSDVMSAFLVKSDAWADECEWRILYTYSQLYLTAENVGQENGFYHELVQEHKGKFYTNDELLRIPAPPISTIYLGPKMPNHIMEHIREIAERLNIQVREMQLDTQQYALTES